MVMRVLPPNENCAEFIRHLGSGMIRSNPRPAGPESAAARLRAVRCMWLLDGFPVVDASLLAQLGLTIASFRMLPCN